MPFRHRHDLLGLFAQHKVARFGLFGLSGIVVNDSIIAVRATDRLRFVMNSDDIVICFVSEGQLAEALDRGGWSWEKRASSPVTGTV